MDTEDTNSPPENFASDMDVDMDEVDPLPAGFVRRNPNPINLEDDSGNDSDDTLLGDEIVERVVPPVSEARRNRRQARIQAARFRELQTYTQNGRTFEVGRTIQRQDGNFRRITSIKQNRRSGAITIESFLDNHRVLQTLSYNGQTLKPGKTVEMADGAFLRIRALLEDCRTGEVLLKGFRFQRNKSLEGVLEFRKNEVTMMANYDPNDSRDIAEQSIETINLAAVVKIRELIKTNQQFPALSFRETDPESLSLSKEYMNDHCRLVCRWNYVKINKNEGFLRRMTDVESDEGCAISQCQLRDDYRGLTTKGGDCARWLDTEEAFDGTERMRCFFIDPLGFHTPNRSTDIPENRERRRRYTFGDGFCGGGGASRGAYGAGLRVEWGFDHDPHAIAAYHANFPHARCDGIAASDFATAINEEYKVDILHLSPPCQTFSPAHTRPGPNDEGNEATFLATEELLKKTRPRIVTLEETFGLTRTLVNVEWFNTMIQMFSKLGFSVRWKVFNLLDFGLPQPRRRLILFASCPGETLPAFPEPTHCRAEDCDRFPHRSKFTTVYDAIGRIPHDFANHSPHLMTKLKKPRYSGNLPLRNTITCSGSVNYHPSGTRCFTVRELACLQGFPLEHRFLRGERRQIGNAVPPIVAKVFFEQVVRALRMADGL